MLRDPKFRFLIIACLLAISLEAFSLAGMQLPDPYALPFFLALTIGIGYQTILRGFEALIHLNFKKIELLMLIAVCGAFFLKKYEEAAVVIVLFTLAEKLEDLGIAKSRSAFDALLKQMPKMVSVKGMPDLIPVGDVNVSDIMLIRPGSILPLDGNVIRGFSTVDESTMTGEPIPQDKHVGDPVFAGTLNIQGYLEVEVTKTEHATTLAKIYELTFEATHHKAKSQTFIETFASYYTPGVILIAFLLLFIPFPFLANSFELRLLEALSILVIACPCALVISTPISIYSALGNASSNGILIKGGRYLENMGNVKAIAFDKTRTLTVGQPKITDILPLGSATRESLLSCAAGLGLLSEHPLSQGIVTEAEAQHVIPHPHENFENIAGKGVRANCLVCRNSHHCLGKLEFILEEHTVPPEVLEKVEALQSQGKTVVILSSHQEIEGIIAFADAIRPESSALIKDLHQLGIHSILLTGDHEEAAKAIAKELQIKEYYADLLPDEKAQQVQHLLQKYQCVSMVGDGVNDAPALALSSAGISMSTLGTDAAVESSSIVLLNDRLESIPKLIKLARRTNNLIKFNTFWAIAVKLTFILLAVNGMSNLVLAMVGDVGVTLFVIFNSLRLMKHRF